MNIRLVIDFYTRNALFDSNQTYDEKLAHLEWFYQFDEITIEVLTDYCAKRRLEELKTVPSIVKLLSCARSTTTLNIITRLILKIYSTASSCLKMILSHDI